MTDTNTKYDWRRPLQPRLDFSAMPVPLRWAEGGQVVRLKNSRIALDIIVSRYRRGYTPEMIVDSYPWLELSDIYLVIAFYLRNKEAVHCYLIEREERADEISRKSYADGFMSEEDWQYWRDSRIERQR